MLHLHISEPEPRDSGPILICDSNHNDIAEFFHCEQATVPQTYETALSIAQRLVADKEINALRAALKNASALLEADAKIDKTNGTFSPARQWVLDFCREALSINTAVGTGSKT